LEDPAQNSKFKSGRAKLSHEHKKQQELFHMGEDHIPNINLLIKLVITFIFIDIQRVKTWLFDKSERLPTEPKLFMRKL